MPPGPRPRSAARRAGRGLGPRSLVLALAVLAALLAGCGQSFDPTGPCTTDGSAPGAYPELEATVPTSYRGTRPNELDSGRSCTPSGLGTLASHGVDELRFAGGTWQTGSDSGVSLAVFTDPNGPPLEAAWVAEFYATGARGGRNVQSVDESDYPVRDGVRGRRVDVLNGESYQTIIVWPRDGRIAVALVADFIREIQTKEAHDVVVRGAVEAFGS